MGAWDAQIGDQMNEADWSERMWTLILMTLVFSGSAAGGVAVNTAFLDFSTEGKCRSAAAGMEMSERVDIGGTRAGHPSISPPSYVRTIARCYER
jgi:hypothetical protein